MAEAIILFLFAPALLNGQLELALYLSHKKIVNYYVVCRLIQLAFDSHELELPLHVLAAV